MPQLSIYLPDTIESIAVLGGDIYRFGDFNNTRKYYVLELDRPLTSRTGSMTVNKIPFYHLSYDSNCLCIVTMGTTIEFDIDQDSSMSIKNPSKFKFIFNQYFSVVFRIYGRVPYFFKSVNNWFSFTDFCVHFYCIRR